MFGEPAPKQKEEVLKLSEKVRILYLSYDSRQSRLPGMSIAPGDGELLIVVVIRVPET